MLPKKDWKFDEMELRDFKDECEYLGCTPEELFYVKAIRYLDDCTSALNNLHVVVEQD